MDVNLDDDFIKYGRSRGERHRVTVNSSIDDSIYVEVQLKGGINITVIEDNNNNVTTRVIAEETNIVTRKHILKDSPNELEDITNIINELISLDDVPLRNNIKELEDAQEKVQIMLEMNTSPHNNERLEYLLIILKTSIAEKTKENENIERILKLIDLVMEQLENPQKISQFDVLVTIVKDIEKLVKTVHDKVIQEKVDVMLSKFNDLNGKRKSVMIPDNSNVDRLMELKVILDTESFTTMELNKLENIYDEILELQIHLRNSEYSILADKLENEALMLFQKIRLFDDIERRMIADINEIDLNDLNNLEYHLLALLRRINNPIAIKNIRSKLTEVRDILKTYYGMENNVEPHIALNHIEYVLNNTVVLGGVESLKDIHSELTKYLMTATNDKLRNQATKLLQKTKGMIDDLEIAQKIIDEVEQSLNQTYDEKAVKKLIGYKKSLIEIMNTTKDQKMVITVKKMLFDIQEVLTKFDTDRQIMNIRRAALEIDESLDAEVVENPIGIYKRIEGIEMKAKELRKSNISPMDKQKVDGILDVSRNLKLKLSEASSTLFKSIENLIKLINTLRTKNLPLMRKNYDQLVEKYESFNDTMRNEGIGGLEERLDMVNTDYYRIDKSLENIQQKLSTFSFRRMTSSITYPLPVDQKKALEILSKLDVSMNQPNVTENIMTIRKVLLDIKHADETLSQAKNILEHFNSFNENKVIDNAVVPEEMKELNNKKKMQNLPEYTDYLQETNSTFIDYLEDSVTKLNESAVDESTEHKIDLTTSEHIILGDDETVESITIHVPVDITTENEEQSTESEVQTTVENITTDALASIKAETEDQSTENEDQVTEIINSDESMSITTETEETTSENLITDSPVNITTESAEQVNIFTIETTTDDLEDSIRKNLSFEELMSLNTVMNITAEFVLIEDEYVENLNVTEKEFEASSISESSESLDSNESFSNETIMSDEFSSSSENKTMSSLEDLTTWSDSPIEILTEKILELTPSSDEENNEEIQKLTSISDGDSLTEDRRKLIKNEESLEMKKPLNEINNDLMEISDIKKTAMNYSATINSNIIVNLKSINSTDFDTNLLENNVKALLEDSINVNETIARVYETRAYLEEIRSEVNDDQQWILQQLESYLFNVELDSLTSKLIADIKTLLSNFQ